MEVVCRSSTSPAYPQHPFCRAPDGRTGLQSGIRHFPISPLPRQIVVVSPRSSKA